MNTSVEIAQKLQFQLVLYLYRHKYVVLIYVFQQRMKR